MLEKEKYVKYTNFTYILLTILISSSAYAGQKADEERYNEIKDTSKQILSDYIKDKGADMRLFSALALCERKDLADKVSEHMDLYSHLQKRNVAATLSAHNFSREEMNIVLHSVDIGRTGYLYGVIDGYSFELSRWKELFCKGTIKEANKMLNDAANSKQRGETNQP